MTAAVIPLRRPPPPEALMLAGLLSAIADPQLRDYCLQQLRAAGSATEVADALELLRALGQPAAAPAARVAAAGSGPVADIGQGPAIAVRGSLSAQRKGKRRCIAISSSP